MAGGPRRWDGYECGEYGEGEEDEGGRWKLFYKEVKATRVQIGAREEKRIGQSFRFSHRVEGIGFEIGRHVIHPLVCHLVISF